MRPVCGVRGDEGTPFAVGVIPVDEKLAIKSRAATGAAGQPGPATRLCAPTILLGSEFLSHTDEITVGQPLVVVRSPPLLIGRFPLS